MQPARKPARFAAMDIRDELRAVNPVTWIYAGAGAMLLVIAIVFACGPV